MVARVRSQDASPFEEGQNVEDVPDGKGAHAGDEDEFQQHVSRRAEEQGGARQPRPLAQRIQPEQHNARRFPDKAAGMREGYPLICEVGQRENGADEKQQRAGVHPRLLAVCGLDVDLS